MGFLELARRKIKEIERDQASKALPPIETLDAFWSQDILPRLSRLHMAGRLPDLSTCPIWNEVDRLWQSSSPDVAKVKEAMKTAVDVYDRTE